MSTNWLAPTSTVRIALTSGTPVAFAAVEQPAQPFGANSFLRSYVYFPANFASPSYIASSSVQIAMDRGVTSLICPEAVTFRWRTHAALYRTDALVIKSRLVTVAYCFEDPPASQTEWYWIDWKKPWSSAVGGLLSPVFGVLAVVMLFTGNLPAASAAAIAAEWAEAHAEQRPALISPARLAEILTRTKESARVGQGLGAPVEDLYSLVERYVHEVAHAPAADSARNLSDAVIPAILEIAGRADFQQMATNAATELRRDPAAASRTLSTLSDVSIVSQAVPGATPLAVESAVAFASRLVVATDTLAQQFTEAVDGFRQLPGDLDAVLTVPEPPPINTVPLRFQAPRPPSDSRDLLG